MKKIKEIKEIKHELKVNEVKKEQPREEIETLTSHEVPMTESGVSIISSSKPEILGSETVAGRGGQNIEPVRSSAGEGPRQAGASGTRLYDVGRGMGNESEGRRAYKTAEDIQGPTMRSVGVGRDFAMGNRGAVLPEDVTAQGLQGGFGDQGMDQGRKYDGKSMEDRARGKRGHGYAWEE